MSTNVEDYPDRLAETYKDKTIFISGGTGFMGKVLVEKLLRSCSDLKKIILLVRSKKGKKPEDRIKEIFSGPLFDTVKKQEGNDIIKKIDIVGGDVMLSNLGICAEDREKLTKEVEIIFHCAATIRFDAPLTQAVLMNVRGTKLMLDLAKECKKLLCFAHMSTAYCHLKERILYEEPYPPPDNPHKIIGAVESLSEDIVDEITPKKEIENIKMSTNQEEYPDRLAETYKDKTIFITGGTGLMGKVLVEKLLRSCTDLKKIILLVRSKKGKQPEDRIKEIFSGPLFDMVKKQKGEDIVKKVVIIAGDVVLPDLGICTEDREKLINEVEVIFHLAATVRFDEHLTKSVLMNVRGTKLMLELAKECKKLLCFAHFSTAYCHLEEKVLHEKPYPPPADPHEMIKTVERLSEDVIEKNTSKLLGGINNSYTLTKALSEELVVEQKDNLPVIILRPSINIPIWKEPLPGWTDNINGPMGLLIAAGKGVLRTMYCKPNSYADYIPVDVAVHSSLLCVFNYINFDKEAFIYNLTASSELKVTLEELINAGRKITRTKIPFNGVVWYPGGFLNRWKIVHYICFILFQLIPAVLVDGLLIILGYKPVLCRVQKRIWASYALLNDYVNNQWNFGIQNYLNARNTLNPREKETYNCDVKGIDFFEYYTKCAYAARLYILKESDDTLPAARRHMAVMWAVDRICKIVFFVGVIYYLYQKVFNPLVSAYS